MFPRMLEVFDPARCVYALPEWRARCCLPRVRSASAPRLAISGLHTLPARSPVNASRTPLPRLAHDSGPAWLARPSLSETCTPSHRAGLSRHTRTLAVSRRRKRRRSRSCRRSAPVLCSARVLAQTPGFPPAVDREPRRQWTPPPFTPPSAVQATRAGRRRTRHAQTARPMDCGHSAPTRSTPTAGDRGPSSRGSSAPDEDHTCRAS